MRVGCVLGVMRKRLSDMKTVTVAITRQETQEKFVEVVLADHEPDDKAKVIACKNEATKPTGWKASGYSTQIGCNIVSVVGPPEPQPPMKEVNVKLITTVTQYQVVRVKVPVDADEDEIIEAAWDEAGEWNDPDESSDARILP